jgi:hypothetical protein
MAAIRRRLHVEFSDVQVFILNAAVGELLTFELPSGGVAARITTANQYWRKLQ